MTKNVTISFSITRLKLIEEALKKSERLFSYRDRKNVQGCRRQITIRLEKIYEQQGGDKQKVDVEPQVRPWLDDDFQT